MPVVALLVAQVLAQTSGDFTCTGEGEFPDPADCHSYFECVPNGAEWLRYKRQCAGGTSWGVNEASCIHNDGSCADIATTTPTTQVTATGGGTATGGNKPSTKPDTPNSGGADGPDQDEDEDGESDGSTNVTLPIVGAFAAVLLLINILIGYHYYKKRSERLQNANMYLPRTSVPSHHVPSARKSFPAAYTPPAPRTSAQERRKVPAHPAGVTPPPPPQPQSDVKRGPLGGKIKINSGFFSAYAHLLFKSKDSIHKKPHPK